MVLTPTMQLHTKKSASLGLELKLHIRFKLSFVVSEYGEFSYEIGWLQNCHPRTAAARKAARFMLAQQQGRAEGDIRDLS